MSANKAEFSLRSLSLYFRTFVRLQARQIFYLLYYALRSGNGGIFLPKVKDSKKIPVWNPVMPLGPFLSYPWNSAENVSRGKFRFLNETVSFGDDIKWDADDRGRLWKYNLHYFQYLHPPEGLGGDVAARLIKDWIARMPPGAADAWDPYPTSLRLVNWIKYISSADLSGNDLQLICHSAYQQTMWLEQSLEEHLRCNHLFKNAKALVFAGLFFQGNDAERWLGKGVDILNKELSEQILPDGGHIERSPMYHCMILEDCLDLLNVSANHDNEIVHALPEKLVPVLQRMINFLSGMTHPDKQIALFNDAAFDIEASPDDLMNYYERLTGRQRGEPVPPLWSFPESGYFVMAPKPGDRLIIDCGHMGPDYQPGHAHCDTLSFELSLNHTRVIVDSGCFSYEDEQMRQYNRGNAGHNVLAINNENQSEIWKVFRCARRAHPLNPRISLTNGGIFFEGGHDGYHRMDGKPVNLRRVSWQGNVLRIIDEISGRGNYAYISRLHLNPACKYSMNDGVVRVEYSEKKYVTIRSIFNGVLDIENGWYSPKFGQRISCPVITLSGDENSPFCVGWEIVTSNDEVW